MGSIDAHKLENTPFVQAEWLDALLCLKLRPLTIKEQRVNGFSFKLTDTIHELTYEKRPLGLIIDATNVRTGSDSLVAGLIFASKELALSNGDSEQEAVKICIIRARKTFVQAWVKRGLMKLIPIFPTVIDSFDYFGVHAPEDVAPRTPAILPPQSVLPAELDLETAVSQPKTTLKKVGGKAKVLVKTGVVKTAVVYDDAKIFIARQNSVLLMALVICLAYHMTLSFYTYTRTYDAFVHIFFGDHYARWWWDPFDPRWYTGFSLTSYPPGSQQTIGLLSKVMGLGNGFVFAQTAAMLNCTLGIYRFSKIWVSEEAAGYASMLFVFSSAITETVHVFGQLPTTFSLGFLLNALPFVYKWLKEGDWRVLIQAVSMNAATTAGHHVTTLFGAVFFVAPVMVLALVEKLREPMPNEPWTRPAQITKKNLKPLIFRRLRRIVPATFRAGIYGPGMIIALIFVVLPYWLWSASDPITQVSIPHASRDSFLENSAAGLVFWLVPYGLTIPLLPYVIYKGYSTKAWPMAMSWSLLFFLGTGGTTPYPRMLLGGAFDVLTLDRFTFWATMTQLPLLGEFVKSLRHGRLAQYTREQFGKLTWRWLQFMLTFLYVVTSIWVANLTRFRQFQPEPVDIDPIINFINKDFHWKWRYMTLGFGDQVAWLSAHTTANMIDGNYHSARRLPELTSTPVERLEGAKFSGVPGLGSLQQILATPDKYNLKFIYANDQFYDPLLYFYGWHRLQRLENGIMVWERAGIPPLPEILPRKETPIIQRIMWGTVPYTALVAGVLTMTAHFWGPPTRRFVTFLGIVRFVRWLDKTITPKLPTTPRKIFYKIWARLDGHLIRWSVMDEQEDDSPVVRWQVWVDWIQLLPRLQPPTPKARTVRNFALIIILLISGGTTYLLLSREADSPIKMVENYYDDLDFRRMEEAYEALDPETRPSFDQYLLELSVTNGLVASYGKLESIYVTVIEEEPERMLVNARATLITSMTYFENEKQHELIKRNGQWFIVPEEVDVRIPPDTFFRKGSVEWHAAGRRRVTGEDTFFNDIIDRPELQILSSRLVEVNGNFSVVGELINVDNDPADVTVTAHMFDDSGELIAWYNAHLGMVHKLFPKEVTPFRVDFEGAAGAYLENNAPIEFEPGAFFPFEAGSPADNFEVYAQAVVTTYDLFRDVGIQGVEFTQDDDGNFHLTGELYNSGTLEATVPHVFITYYDENNEVVWVDDFFVADAVRPQRLVSVDFVLTPGHEVEILLDRGDDYANALEDEVTISDEWIDRMPAPEGLGYHSYRINIHYFVGILGG
ncbi:MAG: hypothetical protein AAF490_01405 [Chloroflexota bacterium]